MKNRWSDAARDASIAVRQHRMLAAAPGKANVAPQAGGRAPKHIAPKPVAKEPYAKDTVRGNPGLHIWIPPPDDPVWADPAFVASFKKGVAAQKKTGLGAVTFPTKPHIFYSDLLAGPLDRQPIVKPTIPTKTGSEKIGTVKTRVVIAGKRYTKVGTMYYPDTSPPPAKKLLAAYRKG